MTMLSSPQRQDQPALEMALAEAEVTTRHAEHEWGRRNRIFATLCAQVCSDEIMEEVRVNAVAAYEALLDATRAERLAYNALNPPKSKPKKSPPPRSPSSDYRKET